MSQPKKLIEVAMPIKEISAESVRDKSIRHGHISTLHLWWARRPLPVCRAVVFASLIPDPLDENCPQEFCDAVEILLGAKNNIGDPYKPYSDIPHTTIKDPIEDNLRNRLLMFIGKFSETYISNQKTGKTTAAKDQLSDASLIKWDNKNNEKILEKARKLIWVAHNAEAERSGAKRSEAERSGAKRSEAERSGAKRSEAERSGAKRSLADTNNVSARETFAKPNVSFPAPRQSTIKLLNDFDKHYQAIKKAESELYSTPDRHLPTAEVKQKEAALSQAIEAFLDKMPRVFDPFAGGGAIPLEASRLGCRSYGNDINPVAHIIQKGSLEFPQKYGKPIVYSRNEFVRLYSEEEYKRQSAENNLYSDGDRVKIDNRLAFDVEFYARELLRRAEAEIGHFYPADDKGKKPIAYYWARVGTCSNPSCRAEVPLLKRFYLSQRRSAPEFKWIHIKPVIKGNQIDFEIGKGKSEEESWITRGNLKCPCCGNSTANAELKRQFLDKTISQRIIAVIWEEKTGKEFKKPSPNEYEILEQIPKNIEIPTESLPVTYTKALAICLWGFEKWGDIFSKRQLLMLQTLVEKLNELKTEIINSYSQHNDYDKAVLIYLVFFIDRIAMRNTTFNAWHIQQDTVEKILGKYDIPMVFEYPETNPFTDYTSAAAKQIQQIKDYISSEGISSPFPTTCNNAASGDKEQFREKFINCVITDPPYYDVVAYADLSDFFYVWMKRTLSNIYPSSFSTPQTPKSEECTALKHHHEESISKARAHFENKLLQIFDAIEHQTSDVVSIMFAHQSTEAWTTLCNSILGARLNIAGSWAIDTESTSGFKEGKSFLESSVTVSCKPANRSGFGDYKEVKRAIEKKVEEEVAELYALGFRGVDLLTACFGKAVGEFGKYERVERASGKEVTIAELLEMTRESAFNALLKGFKGDDFTKFYIGWLELYGFTESNFDDAAKFTRIGLSIDVQDLFTHYIFVKNGNKQTLAKFDERNTVRKNLGETADAPLIDKVHKAMWLYKVGNRRALLEFIGKAAPMPESSFWRVLTSLDELLPKGADDQKQVSGLLENKENLIRESQKAKDTSEQPVLFG